MARKAARDGHRLLDLGMDHGASYQVRLALSKLGDATQRLCAEADRAALTGDTRRVRQCADQARSLAADVINRRAASIGRLQPWAQQDESPPMKSSPKAELVQGNTMRP
jgi:hypothetical protein